MKKLILLLSVITIFYSCEKNKTETTPKTVEELIAGGSWKITKEEIKLGPAPFIDDIDDCQKDDLLSFKENGTYSLDAGKVKCYEDEMQIETGEWTLTSDNKNIIIDGEKFNIDTINADTFVISFTDPNNILGISSSIRTTYKR